MGPGVVSVLACRRKCGRKKSHPGTSLVVQCLRIRSAVDTGSIPGWGTKIPQALEQLKPLHCNY